MPQFAYKAKDNTGQLVTGTLEAESTAMVSTRLQAMGYFPLAVEDNATAAKRTGAATPRQKRINVNDMASFNRQLADLLSSGITLVKALTILQNQTPNPSLRSVLVTISQDVTGGDSLAGAMSRHPKVFTKLYIAMVRAGETGGLLDEVLQRLADFAEGEADTRSKIKAALAYPIVMSLAGAGAVVVLMTVVMPKILVIFEQTSQDLPGITVFLIAVSAFMRGYWYLIVGGLVMAIFTIIRMLKTPEGKRVIDGFLLKVPVLGGMILKQEVANFARTLGALLRNGVSILNALEITQDVLTNKLVADEVAKIPENVTQGEGIAQPLKKSTVFPPVVVNMIAIGEETGRLDEVLLKIAKSYDSEVDRAAKTLTSLLEPIIILAMGLVVGFIVIAMLLPIFSMNPGG